MIEVNQVTKQYGERYALRDVSFTVKEGEILGLLGPNGAGKTTAMRIIAGFMPATSGITKVCGYDVFKNPKEVKGILGYLPEHPPLYDDMMVDSYLSYVAKLKDVPRKKQKLLQEKVMEKCGLFSVRKRLIRNLSKGYRQRVALAQALIHEPKILILDEPTIGLDPKQITEIRHLIKALAGDHTVILSTHILPEATMICQRVMIIHEGKVVAIDSYEKLSSQIGQSERTFIQIKRFQDDRVIEGLSSIPGVVNVSREEEREGCLIVESELGCSERVRESITSLAAEKYWGLLEMYPIRVSLEEIFLELITQERKH